MNEAKLNPETQTSAPQDDGTEIVQNTRDDLKHSISRRDFVKLGSAVIAGIFVGKFLGTWVASESLSPTERFGPPKSAEKFMQPELVHDVEVYGLGEKITSEEQIINFYSYLNDKFATERGITTDKKIELRKEFLDPNERYLEVEVRQSAYDSFLKREQETQVDFVEWVKMHVDALNRCMENAKPPSTMKAVLRRIMVVDDSMPKGFWNESAYREGKGGALDWEWAIKFLSKYPIDTDACWAIADDYRADTTQNTNQGFFWSVCHRNGKTVFGYPAGAKNYEQVYELPEKDDSLSGKNGVWLDFGLTHEWSHYLLNLPDEYQQDFHKMSGSFACYDQFFFDTGNFEVPHLSPYLSYLLKRNIGEKLRDVWEEDSQAVNFQDHPKNSRLTFNGLSENQPIEIRKVRFEKNNTYGLKGFPLKPDQTGKNGCALEDSLFEGDKLKPDPNLWSCRAIIPNQTPREVFIPAAAFNMSKIAGKEDAEYRIEFTGYENPNKKIQTVRLVDESDMEKFLQETNSKGDQPYAKMKIDGTNTWFVWFLED